MSVLSYGLDADSTAILLAFLATPARYGLARDLSDLIVVHAVPAMSGPTLSTPSTDRSCLGCGRPECGACRSLAEAHAMRTVS
ncbi:hypothetical protein [Streptomyces smyrnaeus]|uniref:Uncharacterized protein n=1 Tax=Streptomyces smyrnaeus TaxID=1387713 RepID=A0ABS3Y6A5_9ACTN|nr:hypothetical protein [Streptomyces smyrnaeus]MBO8203146.1 hypothetical protein [Streptomyces smyrnaeus]